MVIEICKRATKCVVCHKEMRKGDLRDTSGGLGYYDPVRYTCIECLKTEKFSIGDLIKAYKIQVRMIKSKIKNLEKLRKSI
jgi:hypothetical protein